MPDDDDSEQTISFTVYLEDSQTGKPLRGWEVSVSYPWTFDSEYTDDTGHAHFERPMTDGGGVQATIYVSGKEIGEYYIEDGDSFTAHYP